MKKILYTVLLIALASCKPEVKEYNVMVTGEGVEFSLTVSSTNTDLSAIRREARQLLINNGYPVIEANTLKFNINN